MSEDKDKVVFETLDAPVKTGKGKLDPVDEEILRQAGQVKSSAEGGYVPLNRDFMKIESLKDLQDLVKSANDAYEFYRGRVVDMTDQEAAEVRRVRVEEGFSWRAVARHFHERGDFGEFAPPSNQLAGMALCETAAKKYGEDYMSPPWNG